MVCELVPAGRGPAPTRTGRARRADRPRELRQGGAGADLRGSPQTARTTTRCSTTTSRASWRRSTPATGAKATIGQPAIFNNVTPSPDGQYVLVSRVKKPFSHTVPKNGFAQDVEIWSRAGELAKKIADLPSREGTTLTGVEAGTARLPLARRSAGDDPLGRSAGRRRPEEQGAVPRPNRRPRLAVQRSGGRGREDRMALRRHQLHRQRHRAAERERSRHAADADVADGTGRGAAQGLGSQAGRGLRGSGQRRSFAATPATAGRGGGGGRGAAGGGPIMQHGD